MQIVFSKQASKDFIFFKTNNLPEYSKIKTLLIDISQNPYQGIGKPELLRENFAGFWSRRITRKHRLVYKVEGNKIIVASCRYHY